MARTVSWLIRAVVYAIVGARVFTSAPGGPVALPVTVAAFVLCGLGMAASAVLQYRPDLTARHPAWFPAALGLVVVAAGVAGTLPATDSFVALTVMAMIDAGSEVRLPTGWTVLGAGVLAVAVGALVNDVSRATLLGLLVLPAIGLLIGHNRRAYRVQAEQSEAMLAQVQQLRSQQRQVAVLDERARIAREIHDVLAHSLGALGIQIQAARAVLTDHQDVDRAVEVLTVAQRMASDGLVETRRAVHALRTDTPALDEELTRMAAAHEQRHGGTVTVTVDGAPVRPLPAEQTLALTRAAGESLTNAAKHAPHRPVSVRLHHGQDDVTLTLTNPLGPGDPGGFATVDGGYGLTGMRERLLLLGGTLTAGPTGDGEWHVTARVPREVAR
jgi:signal transduction histidine kinase